MDLKYGVMDGRLFKSNNKISSLSTKFFYRENKLCYRIMLWLMDRSEPDTIDYENYSEYQRHYQSLIDMMD